MLAARMTASPVISDRLRNDFILRGRLGCAQSNNASGGFTIFLRKTRGSWLESQI
jgi:hypothetical protein